MRTYMEIYGLPCGDRVYVNTKRRQMHLSAFLKLGLRIIHSEYIRTIINNTGYAHGVKGYIYLTPTTINKTYTQNYLLGSENKKKPKKLFFQLLRMELEVTFG